MTSPSFNVNIMNEGESKCSILNEKLSQGCSTNEGESKQSIVNENLSQSYSTNGNKSKRTIVNKTLSQNCSADEDELSSTEEYQSECAIEKQKDAKDEVPYYLTNYCNAFHVFQCRRNILDRLDMSYERACIAIQSRLSDSAIFDSEEQVDARSRTEE